jgi:hypothetical protein
MKGSITDYLLSGGGLGVPQRGHKYGMPYVFDIDMMNPRDRMMVEITAEPRHLFKEVWVGDGTDEEELPEISCDQASLCTTRGYSRNLFREAPDEPGSEERYEEAGDGKYYVRHEMSGTDAFEISSDTTTLRVVLEPQVLGYNGYIPPQEGVFRARIVEK